MIDCCIGLECETVEWFWPGREVSLLEKKKKKEKTSGKRLQFCKPKNNCRWEGEHCEDYDKSCCEGLLCEKFTGTCQLPQRPPRACRPARAYCTKDEDCCSNKCHWRSLRCMKN
eukprot:g40762.t1